MWSNFSLISMGQIYREVGVSLFKQRLRSSNHVGKIKVNQNAEGYLKNCLEILHLNVVLKLEKSYLNRLDSVL